MKKTCAMCEFRPPNLNSDSFPFSEGNDKGKHLKKKQRENKKDGLAFLLSKILFRQQMSKGFMSISFYATPLEVSDKNQANKCPSCKLEVLFKIISFAADGVEGIF